MHVLKMNATIKDNESYVNQWIKRKAPMQERYDFILDYVDSGRCDECVIEVTKNAVDMTLKFTKKEDMTDFFLNTPNVRPDTDSLLKVEVSLTDQ